ncbi:LytTR family DNA-binding domain-containing protein [Haloimpatiens sp. FM7315]|uniref:LytTR family DNA-binding domain-containing protein n=1 Tax=Haloimpatiens sp. FM7315 TaxID=3298609 RepID=UPI0035A365D8
MKIQLEISNKIEENEIIIRCNEVNEEIKKLQIMIQDILSHKEHIVFYKDEVEYYLSLEEILFFETEENKIYAHTRDDVYNVKYKLYELEEILPRNFIRVSKSTILNLNHIYSITRSITSSSKVEFQNTHKQVYVSRYYYKMLKNELKERKR